MPFWRRTACLFLKPSLHRHPLRSESARLRTRCFSRSPPQSAQHSDSNDGGSKRPPGLSDLEWMQLQQFKRWRRRLTQDPYKVLFGASNDMLSGKGLKNWDWAYKSFPKWMLQDLEGEGPLGPNPSKDKKSEDKGKGRDGSSEELKTPLTPRPPKATYDGPAHTSSVASPSDSRRPRHIEKQEQRGPSANKDAAAEKDLEKTKQKVSEKGRMVQPNPGSDKKDKLSSNGRATGPQSANTETNAASVDNSGTKNSTTQTKNDEAHIAGSSKSSEPKYTDWRQTALDRIAEAGNRRETVLDQDAAIHKTEHRPEISPPSSKDHSPLTEEKTPRKVENNHARNPPAGELPASITAAPKNTEVPPPARRWTSDIVKQLPKDDVDFITADWIRARYAFKQNSVDRAEQKEKTRKELEEDFEATQKKKSSLHPAVVSAVLNEQLIRRTEREQNEKANMSKNPSELPTSESSLERMRNLWNENAQKLSKDMVQPAPIPQHQMAADHQWEDRIRLQEAESQRSPWSRPIRAAHPSSEERITLDDNIFWPSREQPVDSSRDVGSAQKSVTNAPDNVATKRLEDNQRHQEPLKEVKQAYEDGYAPTTATGSKGMARESFFSTEPTLSIQVDASSGPLATASTKPSTAPVNYTYRVLVYDPALNELTVGTTKSPSQADSPTIPLAEAFSKLDDPKRFISHLTRLPPVLDAVAATPQMLILREVPTEETGPLTPINYTYKVIVYDPAFNELTIGTIRSPTHAQSPTIPLPEAFSKLDHPEKFINLLPDLPPVLDAVAATPNMIILREVPPEETSTVTTESSAENTETSTAEPEQAIKPKEEQEDSSFQPGINPIDGTTRPFPEAVTGNFASPTGFVNYDDMARILSRERLAKMVKVEEEEKRARKKGNGKEMRVRKDEVKEEEYGRREGREDREGRKRGPGVVKTAIYAATACYIAGVVGSVLKDERGNLEE